MKKNPPSYTVRYNDDWLNNDHPYEYIMTFDDPCLVYTDYVNWKVQIRKLVLRPNGWVDTEMVEEKRFDEKRGTRKGLLVQVLTNCIGNDDFLNGLANELWYTHEVGIDVPPGLYAKYFPDGYQGLMNSVLYHRNRQAKEVMES
jgi:hypothetical protein